MCQCVNHLHSMTYTFASSHVNTFVLRCKDTKKYQCTAKNISPKGYFNISTPAHLTTITLWAGYSPTLTR